MSESDLERELHRRGQELMRKLLQGTPRSTPSEEGCRSGRGGRRCRMHAAPARTPRWVAFVDGAQTQLDLASAAVWQSTPSPQPSTWGRRRLCSIAPPASSKGVLVRGPRPNGVSVFLACVIATYYSRRPSSPSPSFARAPPLPFQVPPSTSRCPNHRLFAACIRNCQHRFALASRRTLPLLQ